MRIAGLVMIVVISACADVTGPAATVSDTLASTAPTSSPVPVSETTMSTHSGHDESSLSDPAEAHAAEHSGGDKAHDQVVADRTVEVVMTEYAFEPATFQVVAGETVTFHVRNEGDQEHEFRLTTAEFADHHITEDHSDHHGDESGVLYLDPSEAGSLTITFDAAGEYDVVACLLPDHYELGMVAALEIEDRGDG